MTNIAEILKNAPKGLELYSPLFGEVTLNRVKDDDLMDDRIILLSNGHLFLKDGRYNINGECLLFPSKNHRTWDNWQSVLFKKGDVVKHNSGCVFLGLLVKSWQCGYLSDGSYTVAPSPQEWEYANQEEREQFLKELESNGYRWNEEKGELEKFDEAAAVGMGGIWQNEDKLGQILQKLDQIYDLLKKKYPPLTIKPFDPYHYNISVVYDCPVSSSAFATDKEPTYSFDDLAKNINKV